MSDFEAASRWLTTSSQASGVGNDVKLELYGLFKVANTGSGPTGSRPGMFSFEARAKYDAWARIATEYDSETARERYVEIARSAGWKGDAGAGEDEDDAPKPKAKASGFGPTMSMPVQKEDEAESSPIHEAASDGDVERLKELAKGDVNAKDEFGYTPLHLAADRGHVEAVRVLLKAGADKGISDPDGQTALELATVSGRDDLVPILRES